MWFPWNIKEWWKLKCEKQKASIQEVSWKENCLKIGIKSLFLTLWTTYKNWSFFSFSYFKHMLFQESHYKVTGWSSTQNFKQIVQKNKTCQKTIHLSLGIIEYYVALKFYEQFLLNFSRPWPEILVLKLEYWNKGS